MQYKGMQFETVLDVNKIEKYPPDWETAWFEHADAVSNAPKYLTQENVDTMVNLAKLPKDFAQLLSKTVEHIVRDDAIAALVGIWHACMFKMQVPGASSWLPSNILPDDMRNMFCAAVLVTGLPHYFKTHKDLGIPEQITRDGLADVRIWAEDFQERNSRIGLKEIEWIQHTFNAKVFRVGRLQFRLGLCEDFEIYKETKTGRVLAFASPGSTGEIKYRTDGNTNGTNGVFDPAAWAPARNLEGSKLTGAPISADGRTLKKQVTIDTNHWELLMDPHSQILEVHIPAGERMEYQACIDSYRAANQFFPKYFPRQDYVGFTCSSWLLDPNLQKILPADSNIVRFQKEYYLIPILADDKQIIDRVFKCKPENLRQQEATTSLQKAILEHIKSGGQLHNGYGFIPKGEIGEPHLYSFEKEILSNIF